jgi:hypothetical protein
VSTALRGLTTTPALSGPWKATPNDSAKAG